jgi:U3 small nucleolar RNA-associated protein 3
MLKKESPEVIALLGELRERIGEAAVVGESLTAARELLRGNGVERHELVDFLETKATLMLTYCAHVTFYLLLKAEGAKVNGHPVVDRLVELRTYMEKLHPVEQRLSYSLNKLLSGQGSSGPKVSSLRPVQAYGGELFQANKTKGVEDSKVARRKAQERIDRQTAVDREEEREMTRSRGKKIVRDGDLELLQAADPGTEEAADHFLSGMVGSYDDDSDDDGAGGQSLIDKLRKKVSTAVKDKLNRTKPEKKPKQADRDEDDDGGFGGEGEEDGEEDGDGEGVDYDALLADEYARAEAKDAARDSRPAFRERESARRGVTPKILAHRGLTKARPKDKKNPRVARREKHDKATKGAAAQSRAKHTDQGDKFVGVPAIKTNITHTKRLS